jgi:glycosyltransferase involved in cell wall biosynthesis
MTNRGTHISVCALLPYPENSVPAQRYRIEQWRPYLERDGITLDVLPFADPELARLLYQPGKLAAKAAHIAAACVRRTGEVLRARRYDAVIVHRTACLVGPAVLERLLGIMGRPVIFDFDDAIFLLHTTAANRRFGWLKFPGKTGVICRLSREVVVGNSYLADYARRFNENVSIIPPGIDTDQYQPLVRGASDGPVVIGWTGSSTSQTYLEMFTPLLRELTSRKDVRIRVISDRLPDLPGVAVEWQPWSIDRETEDLAPIDIGIMPMPDDDWSRGKCSFKAMQYMAMGIPPVCSDVGNNRVVVNHGVNGFLANTTEEWLARLEELIDDPALRARFGAEARSTIEARYSMRHCAKLFGEVVRRAVAKT